MRNWIHTGKALLNRKLPRGRQAWPDLKEVQGRICAVWRSGTTRSPCKGTVLRQIQQIFARTGRVYKTQRVALDSLWTPASAADSLS